MDFRDDPGYGELAAAISTQAGGGVFDFIPSPGNWGDALINEGSLTFFESQGFAFRTIQREAVLEGSFESAELAVVGGSGGWCEAWSSTPGFLKQVARVYDKVILLPTSFDLSVAPLEESNVTYFTRDKSIDSGRATYCPDMAFFLDFQSNSTHLLPYPLICLRRDRERHRSSIFLDRNWDLSLLGDASMKAEDLLSLVGHFSTIYTDRLHVAIAGGMLGRKVFLLDGNYPRSRRVFEATMRNRLPNVSMISWQQFKKDPVIRLLRRSQWRTRVKLILRR